MIFRLYSEIFVEIQALFPEILRFEFVTLFVEHPVDHSVTVFTSIPIIVTRGIPAPAISQTTFQDLHHHPQSSPLSPVRKVGGPALGSMTPPLTCRSAVQLARPCMFLAVQVYSPPSWWPTSEISSEATPSAVTQVRRRWSESVWIREPFKYLLERGGRSVQHRENI